MPQNQRRPIVTFSTMALFLCFLRCNAATAPDNLLSVRVGRFEFHGKSGARGHVGTGIPGTIWQAALALALHSEVRICVEELPPLPGESPVEIEISAKNTTVGEILKRMMMQDPRYLYRERLGVIEVLPIRALDDASDCLNMVIPLFHVHYPWKIAWGQVRCEIEIVSHNPNDVVADPLRAGRCSGTAHSSHPPPKVLEATFDHRTVRDILSQLSSMAGNVSWFATFEKFPPTCGNLQLGEAQPKTWYPVDPNWKTWVEGLPRKCTKCHYHRPISAR